MDLTVNAKMDDQVRTIFDDAEYFSKYHSYKLMPITFEPVNEKIIHIEHNYCHSVPSDVPEPKESHDSTVHEEAEERNYKKRKIKSLTEDSNSTDQGYEIEGGESMENLNLGSECEELLSNSKADDDCAISVEPLDLSLSLQEQKTDNTLTENQLNDPKIKSDTKNSPDVKQLNLHESNKENVTKSKKIEVTISRPGEKGCYEPCEVFLNDLARISPDLIKNDNCHEIEIIDRTNSQDFQQEVSRTYYIVLESTWRIFENSTERIVLTNDLNIGQPIQSAEILDKPRYLIFDQCSLTESLAKICESKGGSFDYTCLEEPKEQSKMEDNAEQELTKSCNSDGDDQNGDCLNSDVNFEPESDRNYQNGDCLNSDFNFEPESDRSYQNGDCLNSDFNFEPESDRNDENGDCLNSDVNLELESDRSENSHCDANTVEEEKDRVPDDCASNLMDTNYLEATLLGNPDYLVKDKYDGKPEKIRLENPSYDEELPQVLLSSEDEDFTRLQKESESIECDYKSSTESANSVEPNLTLLKPVDAPTESKEIDNKCNNSGSSSLEEATELNCELIDEEKCGEVEEGSGKTNSSSHPEISGTKRVRTSEENSCDVSEKIMKLNASMEVQDITEDEKVQDITEDEKVQDITEDEKVQKIPENVCEQEKMEEDRDLSPSLTESKDEQLLVKEEPAEIGEEIIKCLPDNPTNKDDTVVEVVNIKGVKGKGRRKKRKISSTDIKTRSSKEVSVLRNGKKRCIPSTKAATTARQEREKIDSVKISKLKQGKTEEISKPRGRTRKPAFEESKKICLRKRS